MKRLFSVLFCLVFSYLAAFAQSEKEYVIDNGEIQLPGTLCAVGDYNVPVIVFVHGSGPNDRNETIGPNKMFKELSEGLAKAGISSLRYDKRTLLYKTGVETMTYMEETVDDAVKAVLQLKKEGYKHVFVAGHSLGGHLAPLIVKELKEAVEGVILLSGNTTTLEEAINAQLRYIGGLQGATDAQIKQSKDQMLSTLPEAYLKFDREYNACNTLRSVLKENPGIRWLVIQGGHDYQVTIADFMAWQKVFGNKAVYYYGENLDHILRSLPAMATPQDYYTPGNIDQNAIDAIIGFIKKS